MGKTDDQHSNPQTQIGIPAILARAMQAMGGAIPGASVSRNQ